MDFGKAMVFEESDLKGNDFNGDIRRLALTFSEMLGGDTKKIKKVHGRRVIKLL